MVDLGLLGEDVEDYWTKAQGPELTVRPLCCMAHPPQGMNGRPRPIEKYDEGSLGSF